MYQLTDRGSASNDADAQATTATLVTVPVIHNPCGRSNTTRDGNDNHKDTSYDKMNVIVKAAADAAAEEQQGCQQGGGGKEEYYLETLSAISLPSSSFVASSSSLSHGVPKSKLDGLCDVASAHRATATLSVKAEDDCVVPSQKLKPKSSLFSPMRMKTPDMHDFSSSQASEFVPTVVHKPKVYYPNYVTQYQALAMMSSPPGLHNRNQQAAKVSGLQQPNTTFHPQRRQPSFMPMPTMMMHPMMMMPQQHPIMMIASPVNNTASPPGFALPTQQQQQQSMMPILSAYPPMFPPVGWVSLPIEPAGGHESQLLQLQGQYKQDHVGINPSYQHAVLGMSHSIQLQHQSLQSSPAGNSAFSPSRSTSQHLIASRKKSAAHPKPTSSPRKSSPPGALQTGSSEKKTRFTEPTIIHQPDESHHKKPMQRKNNNEE